MTRCPRAEELALYAGGELDNASTARIAGHVEQCSACRELCAEFGEDAALLRTQPAIPPAALAAVRGEVMSKVGGRRGRTAAKWGFGIAAALAIAAVLPWATRQKAEAPKRPLPVAGRAAPSPAKEIAAAAVAPKLHPVRTTRGRKRPPQAALEDPDAVLSSFEALFKESERPAKRAYEGAVVVRLETRDPNVSIVLLESSRGDME